MNIVDKLLNMQKPIEHTKDCDCDYWCKDCNIGFCSCSYEGDDHDNDPKNEGHKVYDAIYRLTENAKPLYIVGEEIPELKPLLNPDPPKPINTKKDVETLIKMLNEKGIPSPTDLWIGRNEAKFTVDGPRNSIAIYRIWGMGIVDVWFGKSDDDSGGMATQGSLEHDSSGMKSIVDLHSRFYKSGRRKVLRHYRRY